MTMYGRDANGIQAHRNSTREAEIKTILDAVNHALHHEGIPDRQRIRIMNRLTYGQPEGADTYWRIDPTTGNDYTAETRPADHRQQLPMDIHVPVPLLEESPRTLATLPAAKAQEWALRPDGSIPGRLEPRDVTYTDVTADRLRRGGPDLHQAIHDDRGQLSHRILEINWVTTGTDP